MFGEVIGITCKGTCTAKFAACRASAIGRTSTGVPVKPSSRSTRLGPSPRDLLARGSMAQHIAGSAREFMAGRGDARSLQEEAAIVVAGGGSLRREFMAVRPGWISDARPPWGLRRGRKGPPPHSNSL